MSRLENRQPILSGIDNIKNWTRLNMSGTVILSSDHDLYKHLPESLQKHIQTGNGVIVDIAGNIRQISNNTSENQD